MARGETGLMRQHTVLNEIQRQTRRGCEERGSHIVLEGLPGEDIIPRSAVCHLRVFG